MKEAIQSQKCYGSDIDYQWNHEKLLLENKCMKPSQKNISIYMKKKGLRIIFQLYFIYLIYMLINWLKTKFIIIFFNNR